MREHANTVILNPGDDLGRILITAERRSGDSTNQVVLHPVLRWPISGGPCVVGDISSKLSFLGVQIRNDCAYPVLEVIVDDLLPIGLRHRAVGIGPGGFIYLTKGPALPTDLIVRIEYQTLPILSWGVPVVHLGERSFRIDLIKVVMGSCKEVRNEVHIRQVSAVNRECWLCSLLCK